MPWTAIPGCLPGTTSGRRRYIERLETLVDWSEPTEAGKVVWEGQSLQSTLRHGWCFGSQTFREKLLDRLGRDDQTPTHRGLRGRSGALTKREIPFSH